MSLTLSDIAKTFGEKTILKNFSYSFPTTGIFAITGDSGIGKTTLLRLIAGLDKKYTGSICGGGFENCSFVFQEYRLFPKLTAYENVALTAYQKATNSEKTMAKNMISSLGFTDSEMNLYPDELSGGMKQRISIARAILKKTPILILDEPTKEIDPELRSKVLELIKKESDTRLVLIVTHNQNDIDDLDARVLSL